MRFGALILFLLAATCCGQTVTVEAEAGRLFTIDAEATATASVIWEAREPLDLDYLQFGNAIVFDVDRSKIIVTLTMVDWEAKSLTKKTFVVMASGDIPDPDEDDVKPDPPKPEPEPDVPLPDTTWGVGPKLRRAWAKVDVKKSEAAKAADIFEGHAIAMRQLRGGSVATHASEIAKELRDIQINDAAMAAYIDIMTQAANVVTMAEHAGAFSELAEWMRK